MFKLKLEAAKAGFFDRASVVKRVDAAGRKVLSKFGAFVRTAAKSSIRKRKAISEPGQPPSSHLGLLKQFIFFSYDAARKSVVIGPTLLNGRGSRRALEVLEHGGGTIRRIKGKNRRTNYKARTFMKPAFKKEQSKLPALWRDAVIK